MGILTAFLSFLGFGERQINGQTNAKKNVPFEVQLETFKKLGFTLNKGVEISDIDR